MKQRRTWAYYIKRNLTIYIGLVSFHTECEKIMMTLIFAYDREQKEWPENFYIEFSCEHPLENKGIG
jgi:hypothetical protein